MSGRLRLATGETCERLGDPDLVRRTLRLLACEIELDVDCDRLERGLGWMAANALQSMEITRRHRLTVRRRDEGYAIDCDGEAVSWEAEPGQAAVRLSSLAHELALAALPDPTRVHAGCVDSPAGRFLVVGERGAGKTTLLTRLMFEEGFAVRSDELALLTSGVVTPFPRRFRLRPPTSRLVPQLAGVPGVLAYEDDAWGGITFVDPSDLGAEWRIDAAKVGAIFFLVPAHDGGSRLESCSRVEAARLLMTQSAGPAGGAERWLDDVCTLAASSLCYRLRIGNLDQAVDAARVGLAPLCGAAARQGGTS